MKFIQYIVLISSFLLVACDTASYSTGNNLSPPKSYLGYQSKIISANGLNFHYVEKGQGELMLFLHGFPNYSEFWHPLLTPLSENFHVVAPDNRGYGFTDKPKKVEDYRLEKLVEDVRHLILQLSPNKKAILVGHDWGGALAWGTAQKYPDLVKKVVVINAVPSNTFLKVMKTSKAQQEASSYFSKLTGWPAKVMFWIKGPELLWGNRETLLEQGHVSSAFKEGFLNAWQQPGAADAAINWYRANMPEDFSKVTTADYWPSENAKITMPSLMIWSTGDRTLSKESVMALPDYAEDLTIKKIATESHSPFLDHTSTVLDYINDFVGQN